MHKTLKIPILIIFRDFFTFFIFLYPPPPGWNPQMGPPPQWPGYPPQGAPQQPGGAPPNPYAPPSVDNNVPDQYQQQQQQQQQPDYNQVVSSPNSQNIPKNSPSSENINKIASEDSDSTLTDSQFAALKAANIGKLTDDEEEDEVKLENSPRPVMEINSEQAKKLGNVALEIVEMAGVHQVPAAVMTDKILDDDDDLTKAKKIMKAVGSAPVDPKDRKAWRKRTKALFRKYVSLHIFNDSSNNFIIFILLTKSIPIPLTFMR